jgi:hypothetical protein
MSIRCCTGSVLIIVSRRFSQIILLTFANDNQDIMICILICISLRENALGAKADNHISLFRKRLKSFRKVAYWAEDIYFIIMNMDRKQ